MNTPPTHRLLFWIEVVLTAISGTLLVLTLVARDWIERVSGASPDQGSGETEWALTLAMLVATIVFAAVARWEWRRTATA